MIPMIWLGIGPGTMTYCRLCHLAVSAWVLGLPEPVVAKSEYLLCIQQLFVDTTCQHGAEVMCPGWHHFGGTEQEHNLAQECKH